MCDVLLAFFSTSCKCGGRGFLWSPVMSAVKQNTLLLEPLIWVLFFFPLRAPYKKSRKRGKKKTGDKYPCVFIEFPLKALSFFAAFNNLWGSFAQSTIYDCNCWCLAHFFFFLIGENEKKKTTKKKYSFTMGSPTSLECLVNTYKMCTSLSLCSVSWGHRCANDGCSWFAFKKEEKVVRGPEVMLTKIKTVAAPSLFFLLLFKAKVH